MKFVKNTKYYRGIVYEFNLPTGTTCPFAKECKVTVDRMSGKFDITKVHIVVMRQGLNGFQVFVNIDGTTLMRQRMGPFPFCQMMQRQYEFMQAVTFSTRLISTFGLMSHQCTLTLRCGPTQNLYATG